MSESRLIVMLIAFPVLFAYFWWRFSKAERDPEWEERWRELPYRERRRLANAARRGELLRDPDEAWLAAGSAHWQQTHLLDNSRLRWLIVAAIAIVAAVVTRLT